MQPGEEEPVPLAGQPVTRSELRQILAEEADQAEAHAEAGEADPAEEVPERSRPPR